MHSERYSFDFGRRSYGFSKFEHPKTGRRLGMHQEPTAFNLRRDLLQQYQPFSAHRRLPVGEPRVVAVWVRFVADKTGTDWIADTYENNRYSSDFRLSNCRHQVGVGDQNVRREAHQLHEGGAYRAGIPAGKPGINADVARFLPTELL